MASGFSGEINGETKTKRGTIVENPVGDVYCHGAFIDISGIFYPLAGINNVSSFILLLNSLPLTSRIQ